MPRAAPNICRPLDSSSCRKVSKLATTSRCTASRWSRTASRSLYFWRSSSSSGVTLKVTTRSFSSRSRPCMSRCSLGICSMMCCSASPRAVTRSSIVWRTSASSCMNSSGPMTSPPSFKGAKAKPLGVWMRAMSCCLASSRNFSSASTCKPRSSSSRARFCAWYSSPAKSAGSTEASSVTSVFMSSRKVAALPGGSRRARGL